MGDAPPKNMPVMPGCVAAAASCQKTQYWEPQNGLQNITKQNPGRARKNS